MGDAPPLLQELVRVEEEGVHEALGQLRRQQGAARDGSGPPDEERDGDPRAGAHAAQQAEARDVARWRRRRAARPRRRLRSSSSTPAASRATGTSRRRRSARSSWARARRTWRRRRSERRSAALLQGCSDQRMRQALSLLYPLPALSFAFLFPSSAASLFAEKEKKVRVGRAGRAGGGVVPGPLAVRRKSTRPNPKAQKTQKKQKQKKAFQK